MSTQGQAVQRTITEHRWREAMLRESEVHISIAKPFPLRIEKSNTLPGLYVNEIPKSLTPIGFVQALMYTHIRSRWRVFREVLRAEETRGEN